MSCWIRAKRINPRVFGDSGLGLGTHLFVKATRRQQNDLFGLRVKLPPVTTSLTTQSELAVPAYLHTLILLNAERQAGNGNDDYTAFRHISLIKIFENDSALLNLEIAPRVSGGVARNFDGGKMEKFCDVSSVT